MMQSTINHYSRHIGAKINRVPSAFEKAHEDVKHPHGLIVSLTIDLSA